MQGIGKYHWSDGRSYVGEYMDDKKHGYGTYSWQDARKYQGYWNMGKQHGLGIYTLSQHQPIKYGLWEEGKRLEWFKEETQKKINSNEFNYASYFKNANSNILPNQTFLEPQYFSKQLLEINKKIAETHSQCEILRQKIANITKGNITEILND